MCVWLGGGRAEEGRGRKQSVRLHVGVGVVACGDDRRGGEGVSSPLAPPNHQLTNPPTHQPSKPPTHQPTATPRRFVYDLDIPLVNGRVPFHKTAFELVKRCSQAAMPEGAIKEQIDRLVDKFFRELNEQDEMLNFSVAITVMKVGRRGVGRGGGRCRGACSVARRVDDGC